MKGQEKEVRSPLCPILRDYVLKETRSTAVSKVLDFLTLWRPGFVRSISLCVGGLPGGGGEEVVVEISTRVLGSRERGPSRK